MPNVDFLAFEFGWLQGSRKFAERNEFLIERTRDTPNRQSYAVLAVRKEVPDELLPVSSS